MGSEIPAERYWASPSFIAEFNFALCEAQNFAVLKKQFRYEVISPYIILRKQYIVHFTLCASAKLHYALRHNFAKYSNAVYLQLMYFWQTL